MKIVMGTSMIDRSHEAGQLQLVQVTKDLLFHGLEEKILVCLAASDRFACCCVSAASQCVQ